MLAINAEHCKSSASRIYAPGFDYRTNVLALRQRLNKN